MDKATAFLDAGEKGLDTVFALKYSAETRIYLKHVFALARHAVELAKVMEQDHGACDAEEDMEDGLCYCYFCKPVNEYQKTVDGLPDCEVG